MFAQDCLQQSIRALKSVKVSKYCVLLINWSFFRKLFFKKKSQNINFLTWESFESLLFSSDIDQRSNILFWQQRFCSGHLAHRSSAKASSHSRATTPTSPMFAKLFSAKHSAYSSRESICQVNITPQLILEMHFILVWVQRSSYNEDGSCNSTSPSHHLLSPHVSPCSTPAIK